MGEGFDFRKKLVDEGEVDDEAAYEYAEELCRQFAKSPEGVALAARGVEPGCYLEIFVDHSLRYIGVSPAEMDADDVRETLDGLAEKIAASPEGLDQAIPELEGFCDFAGRAFAFDKATAWKHAIHDHASAFGRAIRDTPRWGMAKSMLMEGLSRGYDLTTKEGIDEWMHVKQAEFAARVESEKGSAPSAMPLMDRLRSIFGGVIGRSAPAGKTLYIGDLGDGELDGSATPTSIRKKEKARRKKSKASRRRNRR